ncbi:hypothetical protein HMPREF1981_01164 [Bacteroides pyogenes F0041]|uniref:Uncharacterized protein n=1 Tax=Bacteroides pyogenes F0041 TaxID=1321819 RepID=U2E130_9BACE|nr:hypothetical protein HMPREF1981_01164 [Bacteroides pyogenes F0041]
MSAKIRRYLVFWDICTLEILLKIFLISQGNNRKVVLIPFFILIDIC